MTVTKEFMDDLNTRELAFFATFRLPTLSSEQQIQWKEYIEQNISANEIQLELNKSPLPTLNNCRRCNSDKIITEADGININGPRVCSVCLKNQPKSILKRGAFFLIDFISRGAS